MSVFLHVGQCGNQIGDAFWRLAAGVGPQAGDDDGPGPPTRRARPPRASASGTRGILRGNGPSPIGAEHLFHPQTGLARCILVDTEPKVIRAMVNDPSGGRGGGTAMGIGTPLRPAHAHFEQSGRGNNWAMGYNLQTHQRNVLPAKTAPRRPPPATSMLVPTPAPKRELVVSVMESVQREIEALDVFQGTVLMHSLGGGTGAGLGCRLLETIRDTYPRSYLVTVSVGPSRAAGDTPLQNYNALFTLGHLQQFADGILYKENDELLRCSQYWKGLRQQSDSDPSETTTSIQELNAVAAADVAGLLFPTTRHRLGATTAQSFDFAGLVHDCCPLPQAKFLDVRTGIGRSRPYRQQKKISGCDPLFHSVSPWGSAQRNVDDDDAELATVQKLWALTSQSLPRSTRTHQCLSSKGIVRGFQPTKQLTEGIFDMGVPHVAWNPGQSVRFSQQPPFGMCRGATSVTLCINTGHVRESARHFLDRGQRQYHANAYVHWFKQYGLEDSDFELAFERCRQIVDDYDSLCGV